MVRECLLRGSLVNNVEYSMSRSVMYFTNVTGLPNLVGILILILFYLLQAIERI